VALMSRERIYRTGQHQATPEELHALADEALGWLRNDTSTQRDLEARICAAVLSHHGWEYVPPRPYVPARKEGRKIVERERPPVGPRIGRSYYEQDETGRVTMSGSEESRAPEILTDMGQTFGLLHGRVLLHLSDISGDGLPAAHVGGGPDMLAEGKAYGAGTLAATLVAAILRCEAMVRKAPR
jgi:hypothetical protein